MLRESTNVSNMALHLGGITDIGIDTAIPGAAELIALTDAVVLADHEELEIARSALSELLGVAGTVRVIAVAANFMMLNIIMDTLGTRPGDNYVLLAQELGIGHTLTN